MSAQLDIFAQPREITIEPTREVIRLGAKAAPAHEHVPSPRPKALHSDDEWLLVLRTAEEQCIRWRSWSIPHPLPLDEKPRECEGGNGEVCYTGKGVAIIDRGGERERRWASWSALLRGLRAQRDREPHVADARDLAAAYHAAATYWRYYLSEPPVVEADDDDFQVRATSHFAGLKDVIAKLGGDPEFELGGVG